MHGAVSARDKNLAAANEINLYTVLRARIVYKAQMFCCYLRQGVLNANPLCVSQTLGMAIYTFVEAIYIQNNRVAY